MLRCICSSTCNVQKYADVACYLCMSFFFLPQPSRHCCAILACCIIRLDSPPSPFFPRSFQTSERAKRTEHEKGIPDILDSSSLLYYHYIITLKYRTRTTKRRTILAAAPPVTAAVPPVTAHPSQQTRHSRRATMNFSLAPTFFALADRFAACRLR